MISELAVDSWGIMQQAAELARRGEAFAQATVVWRQGPSSSQQGARAIITADGELHGWIGGACAEPAVIREAREVIASGTARLLLLGSPDQFGYPPDSGETDVSGSRRLPDGMTFVPIACQSEGALEVYIEPVLPVPHLVIVGDSPMAGTLAELARAIGWQADLIAGRDFTTADAGDRSWVVVATQGKNDEAVLERAAEARPAYLGLVGSKRRGAAVLGYLADRGVDQQLLSRVRVPAGLDLGQTTHQEIAVSILAELVQLRASGALAAAPKQQQQQQSFQDQGQADPGQDPAAQTDPVCGMTVDAAADRPSAEHQGRTYYFCSAHCRQAFTADPAAYAKRETRC
jgi:xanthine dehydrogenase accessory factor